MREKPARPDLAIAEHAVRQHGVVSLEQLRAAGISGSSISRRVDAGRLHRVHRGVYAVGHPLLSVRGRWLAAVLACGPGAVLSHQSAGALWEMLPVPSGPIDVSLPHCRGRSMRRGIAIHRSATLAAADSTLHHNIAVTNPARTLGDLRRVISTDRLHRAIRAAEVLRLDVGEQAGFEPDRARSELERDFLRLCARHRLPRPRVNGTAGPFEVDFFWETRGLIVEIDGYRYHGTRTAFEADRARDVKLGLMGYRVMRFTYRQLADDPGAVIAALRALLQ